MLTWTADRYPGRLAVGGPEPLTYRQWDARTNQLARALAGLGVEPGDRVAFRLAGGEPMASLYLVPTIYWSLLRTGRLAGAAPAVSRVAYAGAPMTPALAEELDDALHPEVFVNHFGSTEIYTFTIGPDAGEKPGCAGRAGVFSRVRLVDPLDPATEVPTGTQGQVAVSMASPEAFAGYWRRPDADTRAIRDGWYLTGDLAAEDDDGDLWVSGRVDDMINSGGENLYPDEIEGALARCPAVSAVVVVGLPDDRWGQAVTAFVVAAKDFSAERAVAHLASMRQSGSGLPSVKRPKRYIAVDRIPTSAVGKILRRELTEGRYQPLAEVRPMTGDLARVEDPALLCGQGRFLDDLDPLPGTLVAAIVRSPFSARPDHRLRRHRGARLARRGRGHRPAGRGAPNCARSRCRCGRRCPTSRARPTGSGSWASRWPWSSPPTGTWPRTPPNSSTSTTRSFLPSPAPGPRWPPDAPRLHPGGGKQRRDRPHVQLRPGGGGVRRSRSRGQRRVLLPPLLLHAAGVLRRGGELDRDRRRSRRGGLGEFPRPVQHDPGAGRRARRPGGPPPAARARGHRRQLRHQGGHLPVRHADGAGQQARAAPGAMDRGPAGAPGRVVGGRRPADAVRGRGHRGRDRHRAARRPDRQRRRLPAAA